MENEAAETKNAQPGRSDEEQISARQLTGMPVMVLSSGERLGEVQNVFLSSSDHRLLGVTVHRSQGLFHHGQTFVLWEADIRSLGRDALTIDNPDALHANVNDSPEIAKQAGEPALDKKVMTKAGKVVGNITDVIMDRSTRRVLAYEVSGGLLETFRKGRVDVKAEHVLSIGKDVVVIEDVL